MKPMLKQNTKPDPAPEFAAFLALDWADEEHAFHLQAEGVFLVRPVQGQKGRKLLGGVRFGIVLQHSFGLFASKTRWLILGEGLIERPADNSGPPLSIR